MATRRYDPDGLTMKIVDWSDEDVSLAGVITAPKWFEVTINHPDWPTSATLNVTIDPESGPVAAGLRADPSSATTLREVMALISATTGMDALLRQVSAVVIAGRIVQTLESITAPGTPAHKAMTHAVSGLAWEATHSPRRRRVTPALLREVADVYRQAHAAGEPPTVAVARRFTVSHRTATRWVGEARKAGELGRALGPTAGEELPEDREEG